MNDNVQSKKIKLNLHNFAIKNKYNGSKSA